ncbi:RNA-guided endonuclease InsQ/TnpB family protein [Pampinifervens florentissimum]|uniref:RNA-guided endonuclease InsQ/TnpB family protein n=1 Tax=Pampinifervens florentissimum TaxID=1632019 RepID=UPI0013B47BE6|nr:RNA-guided endonuclease TnpB family protein [Hydrogenobacter sp. T-8]QID33039.1 IS200/IS605 family element transposase accessory protein TnpB [Hydrogenobacter sp. T-8]
MIEKVKQVLSVKVKLILDEEKKRELLRLCKAYKDAMNFVFANSFEKGKKDFRTLHKAYYRILRERFSLPSQYAVNISRKTATIYASKNKWEKPPKRKSLSVDLTFNRTFSIKPDKRVVSITTMNGRLKNIPYLGWEKHYEYLQRGRIGDAVLVYDKANKEFFLHIPVEIEVEKQTPQEVIGIDVGEVNTVALVSSKGNKEIVPRTEEYKRLKEKYQRLRQALQSKGTRSAKRKLKKVVGREKRFVESFMHYVSKYLVSKYPQALFVMEDLTGIRERRKVKRKNTEEIRQSNQWAFRSFQTKLYYKSILYNGISPIFVDPSYTSQMCPVCGYTSKENRKSQSDFECKNCGYKEHADIVGATNIMVRGLVEVQNFYQGLFVNQPNALPYGMEQAPTSLSGSS